MDDPDALDKDFDFTVDGWSPPDESGKGEGLKAFGILCGTLLLLGVIVFGGWVLGGFIIECLKNWTWYEFP
ncbi:MAG: hypothetical protein V4469_00535 [Patescibacteria group bacterium]